MLLCLAFARDLERLVPNFQLICRAGPQKYEEETGAGGEDAALELRVAEQRLTNLIQSLCLVASLGAVHVLQLIPTAVVRSWGLAQDTSVAERIPMRACTSCAGHICC